MNQGQIKNILKPLKEQWDLSVKVGWFSNKTGREPFRNTSEHAPVSPLKPYAGGEARKVGMKQRKVGACDIVDSLKKSGRDVLNTPFQKHTKEVKRTVDFFVENGVSKIQRLKNLAVSILLNPMTKGQYKKESQDTIHEKGFSRPTIDTGQTAKAITCEINKGGRKL